MSSKIPVSEQKKQSKQNSFLNLLIREKKQVDTAIENMIAAIEQGVITNTTTKRLKELETKQSELERKILIEQNKSNVEISATEIREYYKKALTYEAQALVSHLVKEVVLYDDKIEIYFNSPIKIRGCLKCDKKHLRQFFFCVSEKDFAEVKKKASK